MTCPNCGAECDRDEVDNGVGVEYGPWRCPGCGWGESYELDDLVARCVPPAPKPAGAVH